MTMLTIFRINQPTKSLVISLCHQTIRRRPPSANHGTGHSQGPSPCHLYQRHLILVKYLLACLPKVAFASCFENHHITISKLLFTWPKNRLYIGAQWQCLIELLGNQVAGKGRLLKLVSIFVLANSHICWMKEFVSHMSANMFWSVLVSNISYYSAHYVVLWSSGNR